MRLSNHDPREIGMKILFFLSLFMVAGCVSTSPSNSAKPTPVFPRMNFEPDILLTAKLWGNFEQRGRCLVIADDDGNFFTPYWPKQSKFGKDKYGYYVVDASSGETIRIGDFITAGGGFVLQTSDDQERLKEINAILKPDIPAECSENIASIHSFRKTRKWYVGYE